MLCHADWLKKAKALPVGRQDRIYHGRERRPNLVIWNKPDRWDCYCQSCKQGQRVMKEHVRIDVLSPEAKKSDLTIPRDMQQYDKLDESTLHNLLTFLSSKGMDNMMLPTWYYSCTRKRILIHTIEGWLGRDVTGTALEKWLTYNNQGFLWRGRELTNRTVICEDPFSFFKIVWATEAQINCNVMCALGTGTKSSMVNRLLGQEYVQFMFDGDAAGYKGAAVGAARLRGVGIHALECCAPAGKDPKDLTAAEIRSLITGETDG